jgi:hypothetical protein
MSKGISVLGIYTDRAAVSEAINVLRNAGYRAADTSVLCSDNQSSKDFAHQKRTRALDGAGIGGIAGALAGAALAWLISARALAIPDLAPLVAAGSLVAALAGAGAGGVLGWIVGLLVGIRSTQYVAKRYSGRIRRGGILLSVHCDNPEWRARATRILKETGARDVSSAPEATADYGMSARPTERLTVTRPDSPVEITPPGVAVQRNEGAKK